MKTLSKAVIASLVFGGSVSVANAAGVITNITATDLSGGTFDSQSISGHNIDLDKTFTSINPISLTFTVSHEDGSGGNPYSFTESVLNNTGQLWTDFHYSIVEPDRGQGAVFTQFNTGSTFGNFTLDDPNASGPRNLNFTGTLASGNSADAAFSISPFDPGAGNTTTFVLTQVPTIPEPGTYAMLIAGLLLMGGIAKRKGMLS
jgi:hypothetical protein